MNYELKNNVPEIRFPEFKEDWEVKKLGEVCEINPKNKNLPNEFIYIDLESVKKGKLLKENKILKKDAPSRAQRILQKGDVLFQTVRPYQKNNYIFEMELDNYVASTGYAQVRTSLNPKFLYYYLHTSKFVRNVLLRCTGTSYPAINSNDLGKIIINYPLSIVSSLPEQKKIAHFFTTIDQKINQLQEKKKALEEYKKGMMQKIFAVGEKSITNKSITNYELKNDELDTAKTRNSSFVIPNYIRFKDDNGNEFDDWEVKKLGEVCEINPKSEKLPNSFVYIDLESVVKGRLVKEERISIDNSPSRAQRLLTQNDILFQMVRPYQKNNFLFDKNAKDYVASTGYAQIKTDNNSTFLFQLLHTQMFVNKVIVKCTGTSYPAINSTDLKSIKISLPCNKEQTKIANFLSKIDNKINTVNTQIENAKTYKKGLLQKMFV